ncbi:hypothetical protein [Desulfitobacterium sp.]|uniref:hypothetical protein n=1 Tax=Desulfitobacterium sp. TaxID=49981 RepID=UPI002B1F3C3B|nr:hypothetical protein [Desulfitobacterium sp.]MEA4902198.1 hypothetical protein [Desulfitobacterium sp.]
MRRNRLVTSIIALLTIALCLSVSVPVFAAEKSNIRLTFPANETTINKPELNYRSYIFRNQIPIKYDIQGTENHYIMYITEVDANGKFIKPVYIYLVPVFPGQVYDERTAYIPDTHLVFDHYYKVEICLLASGPINHNEACGYFQF